MNKKNLVIGGFLLLVFLAVTVVFFVSKEEEDQSDQELFKTTIETSSEYLSLRIRTDDILTKASAYSDYLSWDKEMSMIIKDWERMSERAGELEDLADAYVNGKVGFNFIKEVKAYDKEEISNVFDRAPAGKKIKTLAKHLGVDAKRAFKLLQMDQNQLSADAWNEAGDTFRKLEVSATVIKDGCKVTGFAAGVIITGGAGGFAAASTLSQTAVVVAGADLVLEVTEDAANISLGDKNKVAEVVGDIRKITEPAASILAIASLPENVVLNIDKLNVFVFGADQLRSTLQDGKVIGIKLPAYEKGEEPDEVGIVVISPEDVDEWLDEEGYERYDGDIEDIMSAYEEEDIDEYDEGEDREGVHKEDETEEESELVSSGAVDATVVGVWSGLVNNTNDKGESYSKDLVVTLNGDGTCSVSGEDYDFFTWEKNGSSLKMFFTGRTKNDYFEWNVAGDMLTFVKMAGMNSDDEIVEISAGEDFFGSPLPMITLIKQ